jgi:arginase
MPTSRTNPRRKTIHILGVPMDLGSGRRGVDMGPSAIRIAGLNQHLRELGHRVVDDGDLLIHNIEELRVGRLRARYLAEITRANRLLAAKVGQVMKQGHFPLVLGGDHSIAVGTISGIARWARASRRKVGVLWVDAHSDINTPRTSPTGNIHGMPLAALLGLGPSELGGIGGRFKKVDPANIALVGIRSVDEGERRHLKRGVNVYTMADIDQQGIHGAGESAGQRRAGTDCTRDWTSIRRSSSAPGVGIPVKAGWITGKSPRHELSPRPA